MASAHSPASPIAGFDCARDRIELKDGRFAAAASGDALRASLTSILSRASLRQAINEEICTHSCLEISPSASISVEALGVARPRFPLARAFFNSNPPYRLPHLSAGLRGPLSPRPSPYPQRAAKSVIWRSRASHYIRERAPFVRSLFVLASERAGRKRFCRFGRAAIGQSMPSSKPANGRKSQAAAPSPVEKLFEGRAIHVRGAREHNLKNVDLSIPRDSLTVITGLSGSGKSSLAFDTIYAEGQRRYVESLSAYARQFLELAGKPDVDSIEGLSPAISIEQKTTSHNPRSTVGTVTEIHDYMRLLWARVGVPHSPATGLPIEAQTVSQMVDRVMAMPAGSRLLLLAPVVRDRKGEYRKELSELQRRGFTRVKVDGTVYEIDEVPALNRKLKHTIEAVVDRIVVREGIETRLADSFETALGLSDGIVYVENADSGERTVFSSRFACPVSGFTIEEIEPRLFSFNSPQGACPACDGLGVEGFFDPALVVPDGRLSLAEGAIVPWRGVQSPYYEQTLQGLAKHFRISMRTPWEDLPERVRNAILFGTGDEAVKLTYKDNTRAYSISKPFEGVIRNLERRWSETESAWIREELGRYRAEKPCAVCKGARLKPEALAVK